MTLGEGAETGSDRLRATIERRLAAIVWAATALAVAIVLLWPRPAKAQQTTFYLDRIQISGAPDDGFTVWRPYMSEKTRIYYSAALGYTANPLRASNLVDNSTIESRMENPVRHQVIMHLTSGMEISNRFGFALTLPIAVFQEGGEDPLSEGVGNGLDLNPVAVHDLRLDARVRLFSTDDRLMSFGLGGSLWFPTGNQFAFASDNQTTAWLYANGEFDFGPFFLAGHMGPHFRPDRGILGDNGILEITSELRWGAGIYFPLRDGELRAGASLWGTTGIDSTRNSEESTFFNGNNTDIEWLGELRTYVTQERDVYLSGGLGTRLATGYGAPDFRLLGMVGSHTSLTDFGTSTAQGPRRKAPKVEMYDRDTDGDGFPDDVDMCPTIKEDGKKPNVDDGCPAPKDTDGDGIPDDEDKCPTDPEDKDDIEDHDGCPETDADGDGILDVDDACPLVPGVKSENPKKNGCPEKKKKRRRIIETESGIQLLENIEFETGKSTIKAVSYTIIDEVVDVLKSRPEIRMGVYGHTDSRGARPMNMQLSKARAAAVMQYIVNKGVTKKRLESNGFGPDKPVADNETEEGRAKNRRVEFKILD